MLGALRRAADAIIVGATTVRQESYGPPKKAGQRIGVVTSSGDIDPATDLFTSGAGFLIAARGRPAGTGRTGRTGRRACAPAPAGSTWPWPCTASTS